VYRAASVDRRPDWFQDRTREFGNVAHLVLEQVINKDITGFSRSFLSSCDSDMTLRYAVTSERYHLLKVYIACKLLQKMSSQFNNASWW
jgi:hypothetical protein